MRKQLNKKALYEKIMQNVAREVKKALNSKPSYSRVNEARYGTRFGGPLNSVIYSNNNYSTRIEVQRGDAIKMKEYYEKHSDPNRLVKSITDHRKLLARWAVAVMMDWPEAITAFTMAIKKAYLLYGEDIDKARMELEGQRSWYQQRYC